MICQGRTATKGAAQQVESGVGAEGVGVKFPIVQARKRHININFLVRLLLGHPGNVPGTNRVCPRDKVGLSQGQTQVSSYFTQRKPSLSLGQTRFVPGTFRGQRAADRVYVLKVYVPFSFPNCFGRLKFSASAQGKREENEVKPRNKKTENVKSKMPQKGVGKRG